MDGLNRVLTIATSVVLVLPAAAAIGIVMHLPPEALVSVFVIGAVELLTLAIFVSIAVYARPTRFELSRQGLRVIWPVRERILPLSDFRAVELLTRSEFVRRYGSGMRVGAGGFLGGFGCVKTRSGFFHLYISRVDYSVLVHLRSDKPWMITPDRPEEFVRLASTLMLDLRGDADGGNPR